MTAYMTHVAPADLDAYDEQWATTEQAIRTIARLGKWSKRVASDSDVENLRGTVTVYANHRQIMQAVEVVVLPSEVHATLWDTSADEWVMLDETGPLSRGRLLRLLRLSVGEWRCVSRLEGLDTPSRPVLR